MYTIFFIRSLPLNQPKAITITVQDPHVYRSVWKSRDFVKSRNKRVEVSNYSL